MLLHDDSFESCLTEQRCSLSCLTLVFFVTCQTFRLLTKRLTFEFLPLNLRLCVQNWVDLHLVS